MSAALPSRSVREIRAWQKSGKFNDPALCLETNASMVLSQESLKAIRCGMPTCTAPLTSRPGVTYHTRDALLSKTSSSGAGSSRCNQLICTTSGMRAVGCSDVKSKNAVHDSGWHPETSRPECAGVHALLIWHVSAAVVSCGLAARSPVVLSQSGAAESSSSS